MRARIFAEENKKWWTLGALCFALFMIMLDNTVVNVALPAIQKDLGISRAELEWTVAAYALTFASLLLTGGKLGDLLGRRLIFVIGLIVFTASSLACGLSQTGAELIAARAVQGVVAALLVVPESRDTSREQRLDLPGVLSSGIGLLALVYALIEANQYGWTSVRIVSLFVIGAVALVTFVLLEMHQRLPMLDLSLFRSGTFA